MSSPGTQRQAKTDTNAFLTSDPPIRGQKFACVSFLSPDDVVCKREMFNVNSFLRNLGEDVKNFIEHTTDKSFANSLKERYSYLWDVGELQTYYNMFVSENAATLEDEFTSKHGPRTSVRAIKIRGVFDTVEEAKEKCNDLRDFDKGLFNIYVASVGYWCPWSPNPDEIADSVYAENQLNSLMKKYVENSKMRDKIYHERFDNMTSRPEDDNKNDGIECTETEIANDLFAAPSIVTPSGKQLT